MQTGIVMLMALLLPALARAEGPVRLYYVGEAKVSSASGEPMGSQVYLLQKTLDRDKATITRINQWYDRRMFDSSTRDSGDFSNYG